MDDDATAMARAVYDASADRYMSFAGTEVSAATEAAVDRSLLFAFAELIASSGGGLVADVGCGPGRVAAFLAGRALDVVGIDLAPAMVAAARRAHPHIRFEEGRLDSLPVPNASVRGIVCWYSIMYTSPAGLDVVFAELGRALKPGGHLLLAFQEGHGDAIERTDAHGTGLPLTTYWHDIDHVTSRLGLAGFAVSTKVTRAAEFAHESSPQAFVFATRA